MLKSRTTVTLVLTVVMIAVCGQLRPSDGRSGMPREQFWSSKVEWTEQYDMVLGGDSRTLSALSPEVMSQSLPGIRIANFAFHRCSFAEEYLNACESILDPKSQQPVLVLGITPLAFTPLAVKGNGFIEYNKMRTVERYQQIWMGNELDYLRSFDWGHSLQRWFESERTVLFRDYHSDGWCGIRREPDDPKASTRDYEKTFVDNQVDSEIINQFIRRVNQWTQAGIVVYATRLPVPSWTLERESLARSGFDESAFVERFEAAGGRWLAGPAGEYRTIDGSHLHPDAAIPFSHAFATLLAADLAAHHSNSNSN